MLDAIKVAALDCALQEFLQHRAVNENWPAC